MKVEKLLLKLRLKVKVYSNKLESWPPIMIIISQTYFMLKKETGAEFARKVLLENLRRNKGNVKRQLKKWDVQETQFIWL